MAPVILDAGADYQAAGDALLELVSLVEPDQRALLSIDLGADPLTAALSERPTPELREVVSMATRLAADRGVRAITVDGTAFHNLGANATWELAGSIAGAGAYLRVLTASRPSGGRSTVGAGRGGGRRPNGWSGRGARGDLAADDDPARPVGEHAALHTCRV